MRDKNLKPEDVEASNTLGGAGKGLPKEREVERRQDVCKLRRGECVHVKR